MGFFRNAPRVTRVLAYTFAFFMIVSVLGGGGKSILEVFYGRDNSSKPDFRYGSRISTTHYHELIANRSFSQTFVHEKGEGNFFQLFLATFSRDNTGFLSVKLLNERGETLKVFKEQLNEISDNSWHKFPLKSDVLKPGEIYAIHLSCESCSHGNAITWWASSKDVYKKGFASVNGVKKKGDFAFEVASSAR